MEVKYLKKMLSSITLRLLFRNVRKILKREYYQRHVCPSVRMEQLGSLWTNFREI
jgi:hypothetical protein